jgi:hypothetical protein
MHSEQLLQQTVSNPSSSCAVEITYDPEQRQLYSNDSASSSYCISSAERPDGKLVAHATGLAQ